MAKLDATTRLFAGLSEWGKSYRAMLELAIYRRTHPENSCIIVGPYPEDYHKAAVEMDSIRDGLDYLDKEPGRCVVAPVTSGKELEQSEALGAEIFYHRKNTLLIWDECQRIKDESAPKHIQMRPSMALLVDEGRHNYNSVWFVARRCVQAPILVRSQLKECFAFHTNLTADVKALRDYFGDHSEMCRELPPYWYLYHNEKQQEDFLFNPHGKIKQTLT